MVKAQDEQGADGRADKTEGASRWWQGGTDGGEGGLGGMEWAGSGGHRVEEAGKGAMEGKRAVMRWGWSGDEVRDKDKEDKDKEDKDRVERDKVYDRG